MKHKITFSLLVLLFTTTLRLFAQEVEKGATFGKLPAINVGAGVFIFSGDIGKGNDLSSYSRIRAGYTFGIEERVAKVIGISVNGTLGKLSQSERSKGRNLNFESKVFSGDLSVKLYIDRIIKKNIFTPYLGVGIGYLKFDPYGDLYDKNNVKYNYWRDGSIRDQPETTANIATSTIIRRDYTYETQLKDSTTNYSRSSMYLPIHGGFKIKLLEKLDVNIGATYNMAFTDYIDNVKDGGNDTYLYTNVCIQYHLGSTEPKVKKDPIIKEIDNADADADGVKDVNDECPGTAKGIKVNSKGCEDDDDNDGVPNSRDKEVKSGKGSVVDENGVTITDETIAKRYRAFENSTSLETLNKIEAGCTGKSIIPADLRGADADNDGCIKAQEITNVIDGFFSGENDFTVEKINRLVDYFFEQL